MDDNERCSPEPGPEQIGHILERISDQVFALDREWRFTYLNRSAEVFLGRARRELLGRRIWDAFPDAEGSIFHREYRRAMEEQAPVTFEAQSTLQPDRWIQVHVYPAEDGLSVYGHDITERRRVDTQLRYRARAMEASMDGIAVVNRGGEYVYANAAHATLYGYADPTELLGRTWRERYPERELERFDREIMPALERDGQWRGESIGMRRDGTEFPQEVSLALMDDGVVCIVRDLSERARTEAALRESERKYRALFDEIPVGLYRSTPDGRFLDVNPALVELLGYPDRETLLEADVNTLYVDPGLRELWWDRLEADGQVRGLEFRVRRYDGTVIWIRESCRVIRDAGGGIAYCEGSLEDITTQKREQARVEHQKQVLEQIATGEPLESVLEGVVRSIEAQSSDALCAILLVDRSGRLHLGAAPSLPETYNRQVDGLAIGPAVGSCGTAAYRGERVVVTDIATDPLWEDVREPALEHGLRACWSTPITAADGSVLGTFAVYYTEPRGPDEWDLQLVDDGTHLAGIAIERERTEAARRRLSEILEATPDFVGIADVDGRTTYHNPAALEMLGLEPGEEHYIKSAHPEWVWKLFQEEAFPTAIREGSWTGETVFIRPDGREVAASQVIIAHKDRDGNVEFFSTIARDLTERRILEDQLRQAQKMEAIGRLAGGIAHDFNNLLTSIKGYSSLLLQGLDPDDPLRSSAEEIHSAANRAASLTRQLLAFSRQQVVRPTVVELNRLVADMDGMLRRLIGEDIELTTMMDPSAGSVRVDAGQLSQVIMNLAVNARDAMPEGGRLTLETRTAELDEDYARQHEGVEPGRYVLFSMSDTGTGMDEETLERIFEPFFTTKEQGKGTGLGLSTVYGIVKQSGGHVQVESEVGRGTTFRIYLPRVEPEAKASRPGGARAPERGTDAEVILLVEDEDSVRALVRTVLERKGYTVLEAENGRQALRLAQTHAGPIDLVLTDVVMPEMGGREMVERLRRSRPGLRALFMSGYTEDEVVRRGVSQDQVDFLEKPFSPADLAHRVRQVLDRSEAEA